MPKITLTTRQFQHIAIVNQQIAELDAKRKTLLEMVLDSSEAAGKNIKVLKIDETGIEYEEQTGPQLAQE
jgi:hypothetical protein